MVEQRFNKIAIITAIIILAVVTIITTADVFFTKNNQIVLQSGQIRSIKPTFLSSTFNNPDEYVDIFSNLKKPYQNINADAGIISHHFLAKQLIADFYNKISSDTVSTVFLVSPDHYGNYFKQETIAYTSELGWTTPFGELESDKNEIKSLLNNGNIEINDSIIGLEHGIYVEIPFVKKFFPNSKIVPLVLKNYPSYDNFSNFGKQIKKISDGKSILIVSSDFSHNVTPNQAQLNDKKSINALNDLQEDQINEITNDCKQCLLTLAGYLEQSLDSFTLIDNTNSFNISGENKDSVTSYISGYYSKKESAQILFVGDLMFDRGIRYYASKGGGNEFIFDKISPELINNDLVVANLEGPITNNKSISANTVAGSVNNYFFTFDPGLAKTLFEENIRLVDLGNNHILNFGQEGLMSTEKYLSNSNIDYFGAPIGDKSIIKKVGGIKIAFISYDEFNTNPLIEATAVIDEIKKDKPAADLVIIYSHWGQEYNLNATDSQKELAHSFIDAGADLVIGSHPHVIEPMEVYSGKRIYYSLGNFIFDQYFSEDVRNGLGVVVKINKTTKQIQFEDKRFYLYGNGQTVLK